MEIIKIQVVRAETFRKHIDSLKAQTTKEITLESSHTDRRFPLAGKPLISGEMKTPNPNQMDATTTRPCRFSRGSKVEVRNEQGAWFPAHVLDTLRNRRQKLLVEYETLVFEDNATKLLVEEIDESWVRPAPPEENAEEEYEETDVVDAFFMDGWWRGVVMSVIGEKYRVGFKSPPDLLELGRGELRWHWDWCDGAWRKAEQEMMMELDFNPEQSVEVNPHEDHLWCAWIPAVYVGPLGGNSFLVQYKSARNADENGLVKKVVLHHQIRPRPPQLEDRAFELMEMVDAHHDMGWWVGDITKVLTGEKYVVRFRFTKQEKEFSRSALRLHSEWIKKKWVTDSKGLAKSMVNKENTPTNSGKRQLAIFMDKPPNRKTIKKLSSQHPNGGATFSSPAPSKMLNWSHSEDSLPLAALIGKATTPVKTSKRKVPFEDGEKTEQQHVGQLDEATSPGKKRGRRQKSQADNPRPSVGHGRKARPPKLHVSVKKITGIDKAFEKNLEDEHVMNGIESCGISSENEVMAGSHGGSSSLLPMEDNQQHEDGVHNGIKVKSKLRMLVVEHSKDPTTGSVHSVRDGRSVASMVEIKPARSGIPAKEPDDRSEIPAKEPDHDQSISLFIKEGDSISTMEGSNGTAYHQNEVTGREIETAVEGDVEQEDSPKLPFLKTLPLWENIESMEVFKKIPQKPHFLPLLKIQEVFREGSAFGKMVAFASLVDQISKLQVSDHRNVIDYNLEATVEFELHGFDVNAIRRRLIELLDLKVKLEELHNQSKAVETKITECRQNTIEDTETISRIDKEIVELEANIKGLKEKRAKVVSVCSAKDSERSKLQSEADVISEGIQSIKRGFNILATTAL